MQLKYVCFKRAHSKRIPGNGPGQHSGIESARLEFSAPDYRMHTDGQMVVVAHATGKHEGVAMAYPIADIEHAIPIADKGQGK